MVAVDLIEIEIKCSLKECSVVEVNLKWFFDTSWAAVIHASELSGFMQMTCYIVVGDKKLRHWCWLFIHFTRATLSNFCSV